MTIHVANKYKKVTIMNGPGVTAPPRRRVVQRIGAAAMCLAVGLTVGACRATGGGYIDAPLPGPILDAFTGDANFGFNFTCEMAGTKKTRQAVIKGQITYHDDPSTINLPVTPEDPLGPVETSFPEVRLQGTVTPLVILANSCQDAIEGLQTALFEGTYRSQNRTAGSERGEFRVLVFDQGEPSASTENFTGDEFSIQLLGGPYNGYTRGGYIEGGNIQVRD